MTYFFQKKNCGAGNQGFTLVEMVVSLAIFSIVALVAIGALLRITDANKKSQSLKTAINNLNFALESMSREMRVGSNYHCSDVSGASPTISSGISTAVCPNGEQHEDWVIAFNSSIKAPDTSGGGTCRLIHAYWYTQPDPSVPIWTIKKAEQTACGQQLGTDDFHELISPDVKLTMSTVKVYNSATDPTVGKPMVFFWLKGYAGVRESEKTEFELQTSISQRI